MQEHKAQQNPERKSKSEIKQGREWRKEGKIREPHEKKTGLTNWERKSKSKKSTMREREKKGITERGQRKKGCCSS